MILCMQRTTSPSTPSRRQSPIQPDLNRSACHGNLQKQAYRITGSSHKLVKSGDVQGSSVLKVKDSTCSCIIFCVSTPVSLRTGIANFALPTKLSMSGSFLLQHVEAAYASASIRWLDLQAWDTELKVKKKVEYLVTGLEGGQRFGIQMSTETERMAYLSIFLATNRGYGGSRYSRFIRWKDNLKL